jgi:ferredoxin
MPLASPRSVAVVDRMICDACGLCMPLCPPLAITMRRDGLIVDAATCTGCRKCIAPCPVGALRMMDNSAAGPSHRPVAVTGPADPETPVTLRDPVA